MACGATVPAASNSAKKRIELNEKRRYLDDEIANLRLASQSSEGVGHVGGVDASSTRRMSWPILPSSNCCQRNRPRRHAPGLAETPAE